VDGDGSGFGWQLREYRERANLSLAEFAQVMHYSPSYLSRIETGRRPPTEAIAWECDRALGADGALGALVPARRPRPDTPADLSRTVRLAAPQAAQRQPPRTERTPGYGSEYDALLDRGDSLSEAGKMRMAQDAYQAAFALAHGAPQAEAEAVIRMSRLWSDPGLPDREGIARIQAALGSLAGDGTPAAALLRLRLDAHLAKKLAFAISKDVAGAETRIDEGVALAHRAIRELPAGAPDAASCEVLIQSRWGLFDSEAAADLIPLSAQVEDAAVRLGTGQFLGEGLVSLAIDQLRTGQLTSALATVWRHRVHAARAGSALARWHQCVMDTMLDLWRGNFQAAEDWLFGEARATVEASEAELEISADTLGQTYLGQCFWLLHEQGKMAELLSSPMLKRVESHGFAPIWRAGLTIACCETGNWTDAADQLAAFAEETSQFRDVPPRGWAVPTLTLFGEACARLHAQPGHRALAAALSPRIDTHLAAHDGEVALGGWPTVLIGPVDRVRGLLAFAAGDVATALDRLGRAERLVRTSPPQMARLRADRARILLGEPGAPAAEEAATLLSSSLASSERLGMARLAADIRALVEIQAPVFE
jgi:transcriptional regulator with XRE-family HTH domain